MIANDNNGRSSEVLLNALPKPPPLRSFQMRRVSFHLPGKDKEYCNHSKYNCLIYSQVKTDQIVVYLFDSSALQICFCHTERFEKIEHLF